MIYSVNYLIINILYIYIKMLISFDCFGVKKVAENTPKEINKLINRYNL